MNASSWRPYRAPVQTWLAHERDGLAPTQTRTITLSSSSSPSQLWKNPPQPTTSYAAAATGDWKGMASYVSVTNDTKNVIGAKNVKGKKGANRIMDANIAMGANMAIDADPLIPSPPLDAHSYPSPSEPLFNIDLKGENTLLENMLITDSNPLHQFATTMKQPWTAQACPMGEDLESVGSKLHQFLYQNKLCTSDGEATIQMKKYLKTMQNQINKNEFEDGSKSKKQTSSMTSRYFTNSTCSFLPPDSQIEQDENADKKCLVTLDPLQSTLPEATTQWEQLQREHAHFLYKLYQRPKKICYVCAKINCRRSFNHSLTCEGTLPDHPTLHGNSHLSRNHERRILQVYHQSWGQSIHPEFHFLLKCMVCGRSGHHICGTPPLYPCATMPSSSPSPALSSSQSSKSSYQVFASSLPHNRFVEKPDTKKWERHRNQFKNDSISHRDQRRRISSSGRWMYSPHA